MSNGKVGRSPKMIQNVFVLLLLSLFAILSTFLVTVGAQLYRNTVDNAEKNNGTRIVTTVVRSSIWAEDGGAGDIRIEKLSHNGKEYDVLSIVRQSTLGETKEYLWVKRLYVYDGYLQESYTEYYSIIPKKDLQPGQEYEEIEEVGDSLWGSEEVDEDGNAIEYVYVVRGFDPENDGEPLCELAKFEPSLDGKLLTVKLETSDHLTSTVRMYMRTGGAEQ